MDPGDKERRWIVIDGEANPDWLGLIAGAMDLDRTLRYSIVIMLLFCGVYFWLACVIACGPCFALRFQGAIAGSIGFGLSAHLR